MKKFLFSLLVLAAGCAKEGSKQDNEKKYLIPLAVGNEWIYQWEGFDPAGNKIDNLNFKDTMLIESKTMHNGVELFVKNDGMMIRNIDENTCVSHGDELYPPFEHLEEAFYYKTNVLDTIRTWRNTVGGMSYQISHPEIIKVQEWECIKNEFWDYDRNGKLYEKSVSYITPGIGVVYMEYYGLQYIPGPGPLPTYGPMYKSQVAYLISYKLH